MYVVVFNAPPRAGKSFARSIVKTFIGGHDCAFADILYDSVPLLYGVSKDVFMDWCKDNEKDIPKEELFGQTPREALIDISENYLKPKFGRDCIAKITARAVKHEPIIVMDSGFEDELYPFLEALGVDYSNVFLIHINRPDHTWDGDSRHTIAPRGDMKHVVIENNRDIETFQSKVRDLAADIQIKIDRDRNIESVICKASKPNQYRFRFLYNPSGTGSGGESWVGTSFISFDMKTGDVIVDRFEKKTYWQFYHIGGAEIGTDGTVAYPALNIDTTVMEIYNQGMLVKEWVDLHDSLVAV